MPTITDIGYDPRLGWIVILSDGREMVLSQSGDPGFKELLRILNGLPIPSTEAELAVVKDLAMAALQASFPNLADQLALLGIDIPQNVTISEEIAQALGVTLGGIPIMPGNITPEEALALATGVAETPGTDYSWWPAELGMMPTKEEQAGVDADGNKIMRLVVDEAEAWDRKEDYLDRLDDAEKEAYDRQLELNKEVYRRTQDAYAQQRQAQLDADRRTQDAAKAAASASQGFTVDPTKPVPEGFRLGTKTLSNGDTVWTYERIPESADSSRTLDQAIEDAVLSGNIDQALALDTIRDQLNEKRVTLEDAFNIVAPIAKNRQDFRMLMNAMMAESRNPIASFDFEALIQQNASLTQDPVTGSMELPPLQPGDTNAPQGTSTGTSTLPPLRPGDTNAPTNATPFTGAEPNNISSPDIAAFDAAVNAMGPNGFEKFLKLTPEQQRAAIGIFRTGDLEQFLRDTQGTGPASISKASPEATEAVSKAAASTEATGSFSDLFNPARVPGAGTGNMRTADQEAELERLLGTAEHAQGRGITNVPFGAVNRIRELQRLSPFDPEAVSDDGDGALVGATAGLGDRFTNPADRPIGGTPFYAIPQQTSTPFDVLERRFLEDVNEQRQEEFVRRGPARRTFG